MSPPRAVKLRQKLEALRRKGGIKSSEMRAFAKSLGRKTASRGSEPNWINPHFPDLRPVSIPHHSRDLKKFTAQSILNQLEEDVEAMELKSEMEKLDG